MKPQLVVLEEPKIEKGIPVPVSRNLAAYPFPKMEPGDSSLIAPKDGESQLKLRGRVSAAVTYAKRGNEKTFCTRTVDGGIRVWRIE